MGAYNGDNNTVDDMTLWNNAFKANETNSAFNFNAGDNYVQVTLVDVVVYKRETSGDVIYTGNDVVYDVSLLPLTM